MTLRRLVALVVLVYGTSGVSAAQSLLLPEPSFPASLDPARGLLGPASPAADAYWGMFRQNVRHTGRIGVAGPDQPTQAWRVDLGGLAYSSAATDIEGTVYVGAADRVVAVNGDGSLRWVRPMSDYVISSPALGSNGLVFVGSRDQSVYGIDQSTGAIVWRFETGGEVWSSPVVGLDGTVYVGSFDGRLYALNPTSGSPRWSVPAGGEIVASPAITDAGDVVVVTTSGSMVAVSSAGSLRWQRTLTPDTELVSSPAVSGGRLIFGSMDGAVYGVDASTGTTAWTFEAGGGVASSPAIASDGSIIVGTLGGEVVSLSASGTERWRAAVGGPVISSPAIDGSGAAYVGTLEGTLVSVDAGGTERWRYAVDHAVWSSPSFDPSGGLIFSATGSLESPGTLYRLVSAPFEISLTPPPQVGSELSIEAGQPSTFTATSGSLYYRQGGAVPFVEIDLSPSGSGTFESVIPGEAMTIRGLEFYVELTDGVRSVTMPVQNPEQDPIRVVVDVESLEAPDDFFPRRYRAVSIPLSLDEADIEAVLEDDFGAPAPTSWRLFNWNGEEYEEYPSFGDGFAPGVAYLLVTQDGAPFDVERARSTRTDRPVAISLHPGWNLIGNPFAFPVAWSDVQGDVTSITARAYFDGAEMIQTGEEIGVLRPWDGMFVLNASASDVTLLIPPVEADSGPPEASAVAFARRAARVTLSTLDGRHRDSQTWISLDSDVSLEKAPLSPAGFQLSITDGETHYARRGATLENEELRWTLIIRTPLEVRGATVTIEVEPGADWPRDAVLFAHRTDTMEPLTRWGNRFHVPIDRSEVKVALVSSDSRGISDRAPDMFRLSQNYPNPFNPSTEIRFTTSRESLVSVEIYDVLGRHVNSLVDRVLPAGVHQVAWDGTDASGIEVPGGVYFYRASMGDLTRTRSMVLVR